MKRTENIIFATGFVLCSVMLAFHRETVDITLTKRNMIWGATTLILFAFLTVRGMDWSVLKKSIFFAFFVYFIVTVLSYRIAHSKSEVIYNALRTFMMMAYLLVAYNILRDYKHFGKVIILVTIGLGIYSIDEMLAGDFILRGLMANKNQCASAFVLLSIMCAHYYRIWKAPAVIAIALSLIVIVATKARSSWLAVFVVLLALAVHNKKVLVCALLLLVAAAGIFISSERVRSHRIFNTESMAQRKDMWKSSLMMAKHTPIGIGAGNWKVNFGAYARQYSPMVLDMVYARKFLVRAHNSFLQQLAELGYIGFICYVSLFAFAIYYSGGMIRIGLIAYMTIAFFSFPDERPFHSMMLMLYFAHALLQSHNGFVVRRYRVLGAVVCIVLLMCVGDFVLRYNYSKDLVQIKKAMAAKEFDKVIDITSNNTFLCDIDLSGTPREMFTGVAYSGKKDYPSAIRHMNEARKIAPYHIYIRMNLGIYYAKNGQYLEAYGHFKDLLALYPGSKEVRVNMQKLMKVSNYGRRIYARKVLL